MIKVEGHSNLYRDDNTGAIINTDSAGYNQYVNSIFVHQKGCHVVHGNSPGRTKIPMLMSVSECNFSIFKTSKCMYQLPKM